MEKYTSQKSNSPTKKPNIIKRIKNLRENISRTEHDIKLLEKKKINTSDYEKAQIEEYILKLKQHLAKLKDKLSKLVKRTIKLTLAAGLALTVACSSYGTYIENKEFDENITSAYHQMEEDEDQQSNFVIEDKEDVMYEQLKLDIETYTTLSNKEDLSRSEKEEMDNAKKRINANPEGITRLSLDILKQKIAGSLEIEDYSRIKIIDNSTQVSASQYNLENGSKVDIAIYVDGKMIASVEEFQSLASGEISKSNDNIPKPVLKTINKVVDAQKDSQDTKKAIKALKSALDLDEKDVVFEVQEEVENDRY